MVFRQVVFSISSHDSIYIRHISPSESSFVPGALKGVKEITTTIGGIDQNEVVENEDDFCQMPSSAPILVNETQARVLAEYPFIDQAPKRTWWYASGLFDDSKDLPTCSAHLSQAYASTVSGHSSLGLYLIPFTQED